ncbi:hypothetical protein [Frondihabitans sp. PAMC 28766]|uniref:hypothetical protein n=1 Tax=Frondihabitans sp. PAMC 28766 TaxID=1795630 RepID=UPI0012FF66F8|nr:hypothetical protein [Frondihabitans sp. PAMC 28766]
MSPKRQAGGGQGSGGLSDAKLAARTGRSVQAWFEILDAENGARLSLEQIVSLLVDVYEAPEWGARSVAVRYHQDHGIALPGRQPDGTFEVSVSRSMRGAQTALLDAAIARVSAAVKQDPDAVHRTPDRTTSTWQLPGGDELTARVAGPSTGGNCALSLVQSGIRLPELVAGVRRTLDKVILQVVADAA